jgi:cobalt/nickel transport protein
MQKNSLGQQNWLLAIAVVLLVVFPLMFVKGKYAGSDDQAKGAITELSPHYKPWFNHFFVPPSKEVESLLFASQAALGSGIIGFVIGLYKGRSAKRKQDEC